MSKRLYTEDEVAARVAEATMENARTYRGPRGAAAPKHDVSPATRKAATFDALDTRLVSFKGYEPVGDCPDEYAAPNGAALWLRDVVRAKRGGTPSAAWNHWQKANNVTYTGSDGGFAVPSSLYGDIVRNVAERAPEVAAATTLETAHGSLSVPVLDDYDRSSGVIGGIELAPVGEGGSIGTDVMKLKQSTMVLRKRATLIKLSNELVEDAGVNLASEIAAIATDLLVDRMRHEMVRGNGAGEALGFLGAAGTYEQAKEAGQAADTVVVENLVNMLSRMSNKPGFVLLCHPSVKPQLLLLSYRFSNAAANDFVGGELLVDRGTAAGALSIYGVPVVFSQGASILGDAGDVCLVRPASYRFLTPTGGALSVDTSTDADFDTDETTIRIRARFDGMPVDGSTFTDRQGYEVGDFVTLAART